MPISLPNVQETRPGYFVYRAKVHGRVKTRKLGSSSDPDFSSRYQEAKRYFQRLRANPGPAKAGSRTSGSVGALIDDYRKSSGYKDLTPRTRDDYDRHLDLIDKEWGKAPVKQMKASVIEKRRDKFLPLRGKANVWLKVLRNLLDLAVRRDYVDHNVSRPIKLLQGGEHQPWPDNLIEDVIENADSATTALAVITALYSGQRISDCIRITHDMMSGDTIELKQFKKRSKGAREVEVFIPIHPAWRKAVSDVERRCETILYDRLGHPFKSTRALQERIRDLMKKLGQVDESGKALFTFHGLRKNAANHLAEQGLTDQQIGAICGMDLDTVRHYTKRARKKILAESARSTIDASDIRKR